MKTGGASTQDALLHSEIPMGKASTTHLSGLGSNFTNVEGLAYLPSDHAEDGVLGLLRTGSRHVNRGPVHDLCCCP